MTSPSDETDPLAILKDATAQMLTVVGCIPLDMNGDEAMSLVYDAASDLDFALTRAKEVESSADMGGTVLTLSLEEARIVRSCLESATGRAIAEHRFTDADALRSVRKRINQGVVRRCEARCTTSDETLRPAPAEACADSDDGEEVAA